MANMGDWAGRVGEEWADKAEALDRLLGPYGAVGLDALGDVTGKRVLDLGCGAGATSIALAERGAFATGVDVSEALLDVARTRDPEMRCAFVLGDAAEVEYARRFDALYSRCGAMFFDDPVRAFRHMRAYLRDEAPLSIVAWTAPKFNEWASLPIELARPILGPAQSSLSPTGVPGPFAWADEATFKPILARAGFGRIEATRMAMSAPVGAGDYADPVERAAHFCMRIGPLASRLRQVAPEARADIKAALIAGLSSLPQDGDVLMGGEAWVITATA